jgi:guanylate kinase
VGEEHGVNYYFLTKEEFETRIAEDGMLEYAQYCGNYYGTPKGEIEEKLNAGVHVILEIEVQGAMNVKKRMPEAVAIMVAPPDFPNLERRLRGRGTNTEEDIQNRLAKAKEELSHLPDYDYLVINYDGMLDAAAQDVFDIIKSEQNSVKRNSGFAEYFYGK